MGAGETAAMGVGEEVAMGVEEEALEEGEGGEVLVEEEVGGEVVWEAGVVRRCTDQHLGRHRRR